MIYILIILMILTPLDFVFLLDFVTYVLLGDILVIKIQILNESSFHVFYSLNLLIKPK